MGEDRDTNSKSDGLDSELHPTIDSPGADGIPVRLGAGTAVDGRYRIERVLGAGGMGAVYLATDLQLERSVALKTIRSDMAANPRMSARFRREAVAIARLRHPNIVTVHDYGVAPGVGAYIVMELLEGHTLRTELQQNDRLDAAFAVALARQVCQAVGSAHRAGVIHLDLKPENIVLEHTGRTVGIKVVDFGLARLEAAFRSDPENGSLDEAVFGTPAYMSPEQCTADDADARSDVYALGCVLFEMLTGRPPFVGRPAMSLLYKHVNEKPPRPSEVDPSLGTRLDAIIERALAKNPDRRFESMEVFDRALDGPHAAEADETVVIDGSTQDRGQMATVGGGWIDTEPPNNLPQAMSRFFGRATQIEDVQSRLVDARLVTLLGPGGIGKTRLSLEVAIRARGRFTGGVWFVELAALADPSLVSHAVTAALGVREEAGKPAIEALVARLRDRPVLVVLDNCEHLVDAAASLVDEVLRRCPGLRVLASSREPLGIAGEAVFPVPALTVPDAARTTSMEDIEHFEATRMFVERATLGRPAFRATPQNAESIAEVCRRLDGIPLAIELAAACITTLSVAQIAEKLDNRFRLLTRGSRTAPQRQQTLRAAIDWSHDLLTDDERILLRRLSVFAGGFTFEAAEAVAALDVLGPLERLVATSFVFTEEPGDGTLRYRMYESVREYAAEMLREAGEETDTRERHRDWCVGLAELAEPHLTGPLMSEWVARLEQEHDNLRAALRWSFDTADSETGLRLCYALGRFWSVRTHLKEGRGWLERVLSADATPTNRYRSRVLLWASQLARLDGDKVHARDRLDKGESLARTMGDEYGITVALHERFSLEFACGNVDIAEAFAEEALQRFEATGDRRGVGMVLTSIATIHCARGDFEQGTEMFERGLKVQREVGDIRGVSTTLSNLGRLVAMRGDYATSHALLAEGLAIAENLGDRTVIGFCHNSLGLVATQAGDYDLAIRSFAVALHTFLEVNSIHHVAEVLESLATIAVREGNAQQAATLIGGAGVIREATGTVLSASDQQELDDDLVEARRLIGDEAVDRAYDEGHRMRIDEAVAFGAKLAEARTQSPER